MSDSGAITLAVTGGSGFIAGHLIGHLLLHGADGRKVNVRALASSAEGRSRIAAAHTGAEALLLSNGEGRGLIDQLAGAQVLLHAGWSSVPSTAERDPVADLRDNVQGSMMLIQAALAAGVRRIIFLSSGGTVYGEQERTPISEDVPPMPSGAYGAAKRTVELYLSAMAGHAGAEHVVLRASNVYGRSQVHDRPQGVVEHWLRAALEGKEAASWTSLDAERDFLHIDDMVAALERAITAPIEHPVLNVGSGRGTTLKELAALIEAVTGLPLRLRMASGAHGAVKRNILDVRRIERCWGIRPTVSLKAGVERAAAALRSGDAVG